MPEPVPPRSTPATPANPVTPAPSPAGPVPPTAPGPVAGSVPRRTAAPAHEPVPSGEPARRGGRRPAPLMPPALRKTVLTLHVAASVGWLGLDLGLLTLGVTALVTGDPALVRASYLAMDVLAGTLIAPVGLTAVLSGLLLCLYTPWGLVRHHWVVLKLVTSTAALIASVFALRPQIGEVATAVSGTGPLPSLLPGRDGVSLAVAPSVALVVYLLNVVLSTFKPFGRTPYGRRRAGRGTGAGTFGGAARAKGPRLAAGS
ncbi:hypothetical protein ACIBCT_16645 [Streptosporangium sp. NPDC050855]|uniref:hypothetical protein n=1 Tax=Streptosporangium sp. NPDC050855 TaxID=3366194 RepID=UPI00379982E4